MYKWPDKDKDEVVDYSIDWSRLLGSDTVIGAEWYIEDAQGVKQRALSASVINGLQLVGVSNTLKVTTVRFGLGTNNVRYKISCLVITSQGLKYERSVALRIKEK